jgi:hypothetical protein
MKKSMTYLGKGKTMLLPGLLFATLLSCSKQDLSEQATSGSEDGVQSAGTTLAPSSSKFVFEETFEDGNPFSTYVNKQIETSYGLTAASSPVFAGSKSGRFELRDTDPMNNNGTRAEVSFPEQSKLDRWYTYSVYFPSADFGSDTEDELITQWHQGGGVTPSLTLGIKLDKYRFQVKENPTAKITYDLGTVAKDRWNTFVFHIKHSSSSDGLLEVWLNGNKVISRAGINMYPVGSQFYSPKWKMGVYKSAWNNSNTTTVSKRVLYYDNVRIGNETATYADMTGTTTTAPAPTPEPTPTPTPEPTPTPDPGGSTVAGGSFVLVNAATEKDILTITNGATISLSKYGITKANIRFNNATTAKSVKFVLSGQQSKTYTDSAVPFALHGDEGNGNYYYGNWNPPAKGTYTLKATPYSSTGATGTAGATQTITFTVVS